MNEVWRKDLFESKNCNDFSLNPLGFPLSQAHGTRILGITYRTWKRWEELALTIPEYKLQHLLMANKASENRAIPAIVPYQVWVVGKIGEIYKSLPKGMAREWMAREWLKVKGDEFTRKAYQDEQERYLSLILETVNVY